MFNNFNLSIEDLKKEGEILDKFKCYLFQQPVIKITRINWNIKYVIK
jgi:hypothetical protein